MDAVVDRYLYPTCPQKTTCPTYTIGGVQCYVRRYHDPQRWCLFVHGNMTTLQDLHDSDMPRVLGDACQAHFVALEFPGYGDDCNAHYAPGLKRDHAITERIHAVMRCLHDKGPVVVVAQSVGTALTAQTFAQYPHTSATSVAFLSPFQSLRAMMPRPLQCCMSDRLNTTRNVMAIHAPLLILHGMDDELVPVEHGKAVADAGHRVTFHAIPGMGHVIEPNEMAIVARMLQEFVRQHTPAKIDPHISFEEWQST